MTMLPVLVLQLFAQFPPVAHLDRESRCFFDLAKSVVRIVVSGQRAVLGAFAVRASSFLLPALG